jgi:hypothetical protein
VCRYASDTDATKLIKQINKLAKAGLSVYWNILPGVTPGCHSRVSVWLLEHTGCHRVF